MRLVLATRNDHKLRELAQLMRPIELEPLPKEVTLPPEIGTTFADNALGKARAAAAATGRPSIADVEPGGRELVVHGRCEGRLTHEPRGEGGFGYDPAFIPDDHPGDMTMAELTPEEKDAISHRGRAARELRRQLLEAEEAKRPRGLLTGLLRGGSAARRSAGRSGRGGR